MVKSVTEKKCTVCVTTAKILGGYMFYQQTVGALIKEGSSKASSECATKICPHFTKLITSESSDTFLFGWIHTFVTAC